VKFRDLLERALAAGADLLATGHYARIVTDEAGAPWLACGEDKEKDQSYFLHGLSEIALEHTLLPLGGLEKLAVRGIARNLGLPSAERAESQEMCFAPAGRHADLVAARHPDALVPGDIVGRDGQVLGRHRGIAHYTVGQRRGLGIASQEPLYVLSVDAQSRRVVAGPKEALHAGRIVSNDAWWRGDPTLNERPETMAVEVACRYRMRPRPGRALWDGSCLTVDLEEEVLGVAPGQDVVCYSGGRVVGGGSIASAE
jgi:tRNA-specific 2-thiouridylase